MLLKQIDYIDDYMPSEIVSAEQGKELSPALRNIIINFDKVFEFSSSLKRNFGFQRQYYLALAIRNMLNDKNPDLHLPLRLFLDFVEELSSKNINCFKKTFGEDNAGLKKELKSYFKNRASVREGLTIKRTIDFINSTSKGRRGFDYQQGVHKNIIFDAVAKLPQGTQEEIKQQLFNDRDQIESIFQAYRKNLLFFTLTDLEKTNFLLSEYIDAKTDDQEKILIKKLFNSCNYAAESNSQNYLKQIEEKINKLQNKINAVRSIRDLLTEVNAKPLTKEERLEWPGRIQAAQKNAFTLLYQHFRAVIQEKNPSWLQDNVGQDKKDLFFWLQQLTLTVTNLAKLGLNIYGIIFYIENELVQGNLKQDLRLRLEEYYYKLQRVIQSANQAKSA